MNIITTEIIEELFVRFFTDVAIYNCDMCKCFWQLEKMYWYYLDITKSSIKPSKNNMKLFLDQIKDYLLCILPSGIDVDAEYEKWIKSRKTIPRCKVILLDSKMENVVLTKGVFNDYLMFPGGKVEDTDEALVDAAIRETYEEIGVNVSKQIDPNSYFDFHEYGVKNRYFVIKNINQNINMHPNVSSEIEYIKWFPVHDIVENCGKYNVSKISVKLINNSMKQLKNYIANKK